ncbi:MAG: helix-turn-helix domain-containing protein [Acidimicrobiales bacterium]
MGTTPSPFPAAQELGARVRHQRTVLGWSLERLAEEADLHWTYVGSVERGERNVSLRNILKLAGALDVDPGTLLARLRS